MSRSAVRLICYSHWAEDLQAVDAYLETLAARDLGDRLANPKDDELRRMARLDCDWDGECLRSFAALSHPRIDFEPALVADVRGLVRYLAEGSFSDAEPWLILIDQQPARVAGVLGRILEAFTSKGGRVLYWSYDDASRNMECFAETVAPYLSVLIHDELPLAEPVRRALPAGCRTTCTSWMANIVPFAYPLHRDAEKRIVFLGSKLGVTPHRTRQLEALRARFGSRFVAITDHSVPVAERGRFAGIQVHLCPEGRKFATPSMSRSHTDRPFWAGCLGQVPVCEDSKRGGRLDELADAGLILRYPWGDLDGMIEACERALAADLGLRRRIHEHFNLHGTIGPVIARQIAAHLGLERPASEPSAARQANAGSMRIR